MGAWVVYARSKSRGIVRLLGAFMDEGSAFDAWASSKFSGHPDAEMCMIPAPDDAVFWDEEQMMELVSSTPLYGGEGLVDALRRIFENSIQRPLW